MSPFTALVMRPSEFQETFADNFNRSNSGTVGNGWIEFTGDSGPWQVDTSQLLRGATGAAAFDGIVRPVLVVDGYAECVPLHEEIGPCVRVTGTADGYHAHYTSPKIYLEKSGGFAVGEVTESLNLSTDVLRIEARDNAISVYKNGTLLMSHVDTTWLSGHRGVLCKAATGAKRVDNFACGE